MDVLADVFAALRVGGMIYAQSDLHAPWGLAFSRSDKAGFHVVLRGRCWLRTDSRAPIELNQGDVVLLPRGWTHSVADTPTRRAAPYATALARSASLASSASASASASATRLLCGAYALAPEGDRSLLGALPPIVHVADADATDELRGVVASLAREAVSASPGAAAATSRWVDLLLIYVLRAWIARQPTGSGGWLGALRDPTVAQALATMHAEVATSWDLDALARRVGVSRATLARRFATWVGEPPLTYLTRWRMTLATKALRESSAPLAAIAATVGYGSEFAFNRAFKREIGVAPGEYRRRWAETRPASREDRRASPRR
jgi:AraC-like DNA-binding protein